MTAAIIDTAVIEPAVATAANAYNSLKVPAKPRQNISFENYSETSFFTTLPATNQVTALGEAPHDATNWELVARNMNTIAASGIKHIVLEFYQHQQKDIDLYMRGGISAQYLKDHPETFGGTAGGPKEIRRRCLAVQKILDKAKKHKIKIHCLDRITPTIENTLKNGSEQENDELRKNIHDFDRFIAQDLEFDQFTKTLPQERQAPFVRFHDTYLTERFELDEKIAEDIRDKIGEDKALVLYGECHLNRPKGLVDSFGRENVTYARLSENRTKEKTLPDYGYAPDLVYYTRAHELVLTTEGQSCGFSPDVFVKADLPSAPGNKGSSYAPSP